MRSRVTAGLTLALAAFALVPGAAFAAKGEFVVVASGKLAGTTWIFGVAGGDGERCYGAITREPPEKGEFWESNGEVCEPAKTPTGEWNLAYGMRIGEHGGGIELLRTSARVSYLELLLKDPSGGGSHTPEWRRVRTKALTPGERAKAKLGPGFRFAAVASPRPFCITAVRTFDRDRELLRERKVPCES